MTQSKRNELSFLLKATGPYRRIMLLIATASVGGSFFDSVSIGMLVPLLNNLQGIGDIEAIPKGLRWFTRHLSEHSMNTQIFLTILLVVVCFVVKNGLWGIGAYYGSWLSSRITADLRIQAARLLMNVGISYHDQANVGELMDRAINNTSQAEIIVRQSISIVVHVLSLSMLIVLLVILSWQLTIVSLTIGMAVYSLIWLYTGIISRLGHEMATRNREMFGFFSEAIRGIRLVKHCSMETYQTDRLAHKIEDAAESTFKVNFLVQSVNFVTDCLGVVALAIFFVISIFFFRMESALVISRLLPFLYVLMRIIPIIKQINSKKAEIIKRWPMMSLVVDMLRADNKPFLTNGTRPFHGLDRNITFDAVTFSYAAESEPAVHNLSFVIPCGRKTAIVGRSGAGKSTIVNLLMRLYDPSSGTIIVDGVPLPEIELESYHRLVGMVSQDVFLFNASVRYNIAYGTRNAPDTSQIIAAAKQAGAHEFISDLSDGYDTVLGDRGVILSGGQRQRISIARAILCKPRILILDEATSALDARTESAVHGAVMDLCRDRTVIMIAHRLSTIRNADQTVVIREGRVVEMGAGSDLLERKGEFYELTCADSGQTVHETGLRGNAAGAILD